MNKEGDMAENYIFEKMKITKKSIKKEKSKNSAEVYI